MWVDWIQIAVQITIRSYLPCIGYFGSDETAIGCVGYVRNDFPNSLVWFPGLTGRVWSVPFLSKLLFFSHCTQVCAHSIQKSKQSTCWGDWISCCSSHTRQISPWGVALCGAYLEMDEAFSLGSVGFRAVVLGSLYSVRALIEATHFQQHRVHDWDRTCGDCH